jgi:RimJ/RimL family protein N-acetyltransferase
MLFSLDLVNRSAMMGMMIGEKEYWDHGYGQEATRLLLDYGFNLLNLNSIMLGVYAFNERAIQAYRRVGFREIGRRRQVRIINGQKFDLLEMDILAEEFTPLYVKQFLPK